MTASSKPAGKTGAAYKASAAFSPWIQPSVSPHRAATGSTSLLL